MMVLNRLGDLRIFFTGTGGTGKTTTMEHVLKLFPDLNVVPSPARGVQKKYGVTEVDQLKMDPSLLLDMQCEIFETKFRQDNGPDAGELPPCISDRTLLCQLAYSLQRCWHTIPEPLLEEMKVKVVQTFQTYDVVFYFPLGAIPDPQSDGFRLTAKSARAGHDLLIQGLIQELRLDRHSRIVRVPPGSPEDRAAHVISWAGASHYDL